MKEHAKHILATFHYFDIFDYPLTLEEVQQWLWSASTLSLAETQREIDALLSSQNIQKKYAFYFLPGRENNVEIRRSKDWILKKKLSVARRAVKLLRFIPYIKAIFLCNQFTISTREESDVDIVIITAEKRIWIVRFFSIFLLALTRMRIQKKCRKNKVCLSFFVAEDDLDMSKLSIEEPDIYLIYWMVLLIPIFDPYDIQKDFITKNNEWIKKFLGQGMKWKSVVSTSMVSDTVFSKGVRSFFEKAWKGAYGDMIQKQLKEIQYKKIQAKGLELNDAGHSVVVNDSMLKFHENDRRYVYKRQWEEKYSQK